MKTESHILYCVVSVEKSKDEDICTDPENEMEMETEVAVFKMGTSSSSTRRQDIRTLEENTAGISINTEPHASDTLFLMMKLILLVTLVTM